ncbi:hypothetical protein IV203_030227 [Nitzschia inconspicua]|uniref:Uncharacterized protein n=1 Tax=Nitzschia inconspicua TaxID=303405 RepID=A0A9K3Q1Q0_9STRA|nr:hypothetical protein IV203_030227 [Nitzschia inconspicua]
MKDTVQEMLLTWPHANVLFQQLLLVTSRRRPANQNIGSGKTAAMVERQVAQMHTDRMAKLADDFTSTDKLEEYKHLDSDTDRVLAYLKKKGATLCALYIMELVVVAREDGKLLNVSPF